MNKTSTPRASITALIPAGNEARNIAECIASVDWVDEVFVIDSFSRDDTPEIARCLGARVAQHEYVNSATQKNWAIPQATHEWILVVDADERVTPDLRDEIIAVLEQAARDPQSVEDGYRVGRINHFLGRRVNYCGWQNDTVLRLFRRDRGKYQDREVHADVIIDSGRVGWLRRKLLHFTYVSFEHYLKKFDQYTTWASGDRARRTPEVKWHHLLARPAFRFFKQYVLKLGFLDGKVGIVVCMLASYSVFMKYAKLYERRLNEAQKDRAHAE